MKRGDLITAVLPGNYGKPRLCVIVQSNRLAALDSIILCPLTSDLETSGPTRLPVEATPLQIDQTQRSLATRIQSARAGA